MRGAQFTETRLASSGWQLGQAKRVKQEEAHRDNRQWRTRREGPAPATGGRATLRLPRRQLTTEKGLSHHKLSS